MKRRILEGKKLEWAGLVLFAIAYVVISAFHEPWFDEAQAWQIAKCASLREILFEIPHYEGHPPLWHLILAIPAKLGVPFEIGLKTVGFLFSAASAYLILFRMPYPRLMRLLIPFSYFIFYQYGVIVRPYGLMLLVFLLLALAFPKKDIRPWRFVGLLMLLCLTNAYGIVIAGGIAVCWVWELVREKGMKNLLAGLLKDGRSLALSALLVFAILLIWMILPRSDTLTFSEGRTNSFLLCLICALFTFIGECTITTSSWFSTDRVLLQRASISAPELIIFCLIGILIWFLLLCISSRRVLKYLIVPYLQLCIFAAAVFFNVHHLGIVLLLLLFWAGILFRDGQRFEIGASVLRKLAKSERDKSILKQAALLVFAACLLVPIYWCIHASVLDMKKEYCYGRSGAEFLRETGLDQCRILALWDEGGTFKTKGEEETVIPNTNFVPSAVVLNAFFDRNICMNLNCGKDSEAYLHSRAASEADNARAFKQWVAAGVPDLLLGKVDLEALYGDVSLDDYTIVFAMRSNYIWKNSANAQSFPVLARNDILEQYGLNELDDKRLQYLVEGLQITPEMREAFENGVPIEEILKPYLDAMFGAE